MPYDSPGQIDPEAPGYEPGTNPWNGPGDAGRGMPGAAGSQADAEAARKAAYTQLQAAYKRWLKREASESEMESHLGGRYDSATVQRALQAIQNSPEAIEAARRPASSTTETGGTTREDRDKLTWGSTGNMEGFRVGYDYGGDTKARNSVKNTFGRIASRYPSTPEGLKQVVNDPDFKRFFPNAKLVEGGAGDKIDFGGVKSDFESGDPVGVVDVGRSFDPANNTGGGWWWGYGDGGSGNQSSQQSQQTQNRERDTDSGGDTGQGGTSGGSSAPPRDSTERENFGTQATQATSANTYSDVQDAILNPTGAGDIRDPNVQAAILGEGTGDDPLSEYVRYMNWVRAQSRFR